MSDIAIRVENLGKEYHIGSAPAGYRTFRETVTDAVASPFRRLGGLARGNASAASELSESFWALRDVSFEVKQGEVLGVIGRNGAGKSTLLKVLSRITEPTTGRVELHGRVGSLLEVGTGFHPELTGRENIFLNGAILGMSREDIQRRFDEIVEFAEISRFLDTPVKRYSSGMYMRLAFSVAAHLQPEVLVVDEVLAVGDLAFQQKCLGKMQDVASQGRTVLFVSHNMGAVLKLCTRGILLDGGKIVKSGSAASVVEQFQQDVRRIARAEGLAPHVLFEAPEKMERDKFAITRVEALDPEGRPLEKVAIWNQIALRLTFHAPRPVQRGSVVLAIQSPEGMPLVLLSTQPDGTLDLPFVGGLQSVECCIDSLPLASGEFGLSLGLAIPNVEWLLPMREYCALRVEPTDVYGSGLIPQSSRSTLALRHEWRAIS